MNTGIKATFRLPVLAACLLLLVLVGCGNRKQDDTVMDDCDPYKGYFKGGEHYIEADSVNEDGTMNRYYMLEKYSNPKNNPCNPRYRRHRKTVRNIN